MPNFAISNLTTTNFPTVDSVVPCVQNGVTKQISVFQIKQYLDDGTVREISSGDGYQCNPNPITETGSISFVSPGLMSLYAGGSDPTGWLICNGRSFSTSSYPELFSKIGYRYGGSGASFNIPNLVGRAVFGLDNLGSTPAGRITQGTPTSIGSTFGSNTHQLSSSETPLLSHDHGTRYSNFSRRYGNNHQGNNTGCCQQDGVTSTPTGGFRCYGLTVSINNSVVNTGSSHQNLPPYLNLNWIIKT